MADMANLQMDREVISEFRMAVMRRHGTTYGKMGEEGEKALLNHIRLMEEEAGGTVREVISEDVIRQRTARELLDAVPDDAAVF
jgi:hypothetical protein